MQVSINLIMVLIAGTQYTYCTIPDGLSFFPLPEVWTIIWFFVVFFVSFTFSVYTVTAAVNSLIEVHPTMIRLRVIYAAITCLSCMVVAMIPVTDNGRSFFNNWINVAYPLALSVVFLFYSVAMSYIYTIDEVIIDYVYMYGQRPINYWILNWKTAPVMFLVCISVNHSMNRSYQLDLRPLALGSRTTKARRPPMLRFSHFRVLFLTKQTYKCRNLIHLLSNTHSRYI